MSLFFSVAATVALFGFGVQHIQAQSEPVTTGLSASAQERITNLVANMSNRFDATIVRLDNIANRLDARLEKEAAGGVNVTASRSHLEAARIALENAKQKASETDTMAATTVTSLEPRLKWSGLRAHLLSIKQLVIEAHSELLRSVATLKNPPEATTTTASSTASTSASSADTIAPESEETII
ncbi:hypothetical protein KC722_02300 [Candidatus Kaiserbacteria bacterium]|nr:hypothetical protein [Candidatus Kaiserbacteria bacterium]